MLNVQDQDRLINALNQCQQAHTMFGSCLSEAMIIVARINGSPASGRQLENLLGSNTQDAARLYSQPIVDMAAMTVTWAGRSHRLSNTLLLRLIERLSRRPNHFVSYERLLRDAWEGNERTDEAIRNAVHRLKARLRQAGMADLACALRTSGRQCGLILDAAG